MSTVTVFESSARVVLLTDESLYSADATIIGFDQKALPVESWNGAISGRGDMWGIRAGIELAERYGSFDEFIARSGTEIRAAHEAALSKAGAGLGQTVIEIHAVGWSEQEDRARAFFLRAGMPGKDTSTDYAWRTHDDEDGCFYPDLGELECWRLHRQGAEPRVDYTAATFDPSRHAMPLMEAQRRGKANALYGAAIGGKHIVGGAAWMTVVDRDGTRQGVLHEWPDAVGEPIQPGPFDEAKWPLIPPAMWSELPDHAPHFAEMWRRGLVDTQTMLPRLDRMAEVRAITAGSAGGGTRQQRRAAKAQAKKARVHAA